jgi:hypothetical protein
VSRGFAGEGHESSTLGLTKSRVARTREGKLNIASRGFVKGRCQDSTLQLAKGRVASSAKGRSTFADFQVSEDRIREEREFNR